jgi:hypothetical protein
MFIHLCSELGNFKQKNQWRPCVCLGVNKITFTPVPWKFVTLWKQVLHTRPTSCLSRDKQNHYCYIQTYKIFCNHSTENKKQESYIRVSDTLHRPHLIRATLLQIQNYSSNLTLSQSIIIQDILGLKLHLYYSLFLFLIKYLTPLLRHCATSRKVEGSIPDSVTGIFHWHNTSGRTVALGLTQPLTEMSTRNISWG